MLADTGLLEVILEDLSGLLEGEHLGLDLGNLVVLLLALELFAHLVHLLVLASAGFLDLVLLHALGQLVDSVPQLLAPTVLLLELLPHPLQLLNLSPQLHVLSLYLKGVLELVDSFRELTVAFFHVRYLALKSADILL